MELPDTQLAVLEAASATDPTPVDVLADQLDEKPETVTGAAFALEEAGLLAIEESTESSVSVTEEGRRYAEEGLPEHRLLDAALDAGAVEDPVPIGEVLGAAGLEGEAVDIALSNFARKGYGEIEAGAVAADRETVPDDDLEATTLERLAAGEEPADDAVAELERRSLVAVDERTVRSVTLTDDGVDALMAGVEAEETVDRLTPDLLTTGEWRDVEFADYNVAADAEPVHAGRLHPLRALIERVKEVLVGMGFAEMQGPHADAEFWINDCLFMPQDHPARTHWDQFALDVPPMDDLPEDLLERVRAAHREGVGEEGEGYHSPWSADVARQVDLRGHTTSLSMRHLAGVAADEIEPPARYFSVEKAYRNDTIDATHLLEFFQVEGWVMAEDLSVRDLMGTFEEFYAHFGIEDLSYKPTYNPYTEPSFELFGEHPETGETIEIGNSGIFRREVLEPLGIDHDVIAWGLALERLYMLFTGAADIRDVHGTLVDLEFVRDAEVRP